ncbi:MAG: DUF368 domain-containing protein [Planctomycetota bacterium]
MSTTSEPATRSEDNTPQPTVERAPVVRTLITGGLMGLANLVPGVSGGTMVLVMGLYEKFIASVAAVSRGRPTKSALFFLGLVIAGAGVTIVALSGLMESLVVDHRTIMYALFIGMTLAGTPVLWKMARPFKPAGIVCFVVALAGMVGLAVSSDEEAKDLADATRESETFRPEADIPADLAAGALGMSSMVLPGISGAYMLLLIGRYEHVLGSVSQLKDGVIGLAKDGGGAMTEITDALWILVPVGFSAVLSLVLFSNLLKWLLKHHEKAMGGLLLGVLWGSAFAIYPFTAASTGGEYVKGGVAFALGFAAVFALTLLAPKEPGGEDVEASNTVEPSKNA